MPNVNGPMVEEVMARLESEDRVLYEWRCTPSDLQALAVGRLYADGLLSDASDLVVQRTPDNEITILLSSDPLTRDEEGHRLSGELPDAAVFGELFRQLFASADERHESGGMHAAALADAEGIAFQAEDVGRHNTVDKAIGMAVLAERDPADFGLLISARVSGEIARKAARAGVAWLATRSIPTTLAVNVASKAGMPIVGRAASKAAFIYR